jgi:hypothetical protein
LDFSEVKLQPCQNLSFLFSNNTLAPPGKVFAANAIGELEKLDRDDVNHLIDILNRGRA